MSLQYFYDLLSQPSRALYIFLKINNIPFTSCPVKLKNGEHLSDKFKELNRFRKVPFIHHNNFKLSESVAIVRYVAREFNIDNNWYPKLSQRQAEIDEYLEWQHNNTRALCAMYFQKKWLLPLLGAEQPSERLIQSLEHKMKECLDIIETIWLDNKLFITGDEISVADLFAACEIEQTRIAGFDPNHERPILSAWLARVRQSTNPLYDEAHVVVNKLASKTNKSKL